MRLISPFEGDGNEVAWMVVSEHGRAAIVGWYQVLNRPVPPQDRLRLRGLAPGSSYIVATWPSADDGVERSNVGSRRGDELMAVGLSLAASKNEAAARGDFTARLFVLEAV